MREPKEGVLVTTIGPNHQVPLYLFFFPVLSGLRQQIQRLYVVSSRRLQSYFHQVNVHVAISGSLAGRRRREDDALLFLALVGLLFVAPQRSQNLELARNLHCALIAQPNFLY